jgi:hypothetical protein
MKKTIIALGIFFISALAMAAQIAQSNDGSGENRTENDMNDADHSMPRTVPSASDSNGTYGNAPGTAANPNPNPNQYPRTAPSATNTTSY